MTIIRSRFTVSANLPAERPAAKDEKPADKAKLDKAFKDAAGQAQAEKLAKEKQFENWIYLLPTYSVDSVIKTRDQLLVERKKKPRKQAKMPRRQRGNRRGFIGLSFPPAGNPPLTKTQLPEFPAPDNNYARG